MLSHAIRIHRLFAGFLTLLLATVVVNGPTAVLAQQESLDNYLIMSVPKLRQIVYVVVNRDTTLRPLVIDKIISPKGI